MELNNITHKITTNIIMAPKKVCSNYDIHREKRAQRTIRRRTRLRRHRMYSKVEMSVSGSHIGRQNRE